MDGLGDWATALGAKTTAYNQSISTCPSVMSGGEDIGCLDAITKEGNILGAIALAFLVLEVSLHRYFVMVHPTIDIPAV